MPDLIPDRKGFATYTLDHVCLSGGFLYPQTPNFLASLFEQEPIKGWLGLLKIHTLPFTPESPFDSSTLTSSQSRLLQQKRIYLPLQNQ